jgi:ketosteroid isomerase-like protein
MLYDHAMHADTTPLGVVRAVDRAWIAGDLDALDDLLDPAMVIVDSDGRHVAVGRDACEASYRVFTERAAVSDFEPHDEQVDVAVDTAVVSYGYHIAYVLGGEALDEEGREVVVLARNEGAWRVVWRMPLPAA